MILHPRFRSLVRYAEGGPGDPDRARLSAHLAGCARCRDTVAALREVAGAAREVPVPPAPADALERILARRAAGERVLLPAADAPAPRRRPRTLAAAAASLVVLVAASSLFLRAPELQADESELRFLPMRPQAGATVTVEYRATAKLAGEDHLVLRARYRVPEEPRANWQIPHRSVAELRRVDDRTFRGTFRIPDTVVYGVFAVEDPRAERVDANAEAWELLVHAPDGRPLPDALKQRREDLLERNSRLAGETARELARLYPDRPWHRLMALWTEREEADQASADSVLRAHRARLPELHARLWRERSPSPDDVGGMVRYARTVGDTTLGRLWRERQLRDHPTDTWAVQERVLALGAAHRDDPARLLAEYEELWAEAGPVSPQLAYSGFQVALRAEAPRPARLWGERILRHAPDLRPLVVHNLARLPGTREEGMELLREELRRLDRMPDQDRTLTQTAADQREANRVTAGYFLANLGQALLAAGRTAAGLDTLDRAVEGRWDPALFRTLAAARLQIGDTAGTVALVARIAADPATPATYADSARATLGRHWDGARWPARVDSAREEMREIVLGSAVDRALRGRVRLAAADGSPYRLQPDGETETLVVFWSRHCPPSLEQLGELQAVSDRLRERGARVLAVTDEPPSEDVRRFLAEKGLTFPAYFDVDRDARRAFDNGATPHYFVLDAAGRIRFEGHTPSSGEREIAALREARR